ncbi:unnamed protein product [Symbiodinium sp. CCMP2456]|nr:unnamed protein product [Symbiodinium sp. CCMP2456]
MASLQDDLAKLLLPLSPRERQHLESRCLSSHPLDLLSVLETGPPNHLASVLLGRRMQECWPTLAVSDRMFLQARLLHAMEFPSSDSAVKIIADCVAAVACNLAAEGVMWLELLLWIRKVAAKGERPLAAVASLQLHGVMCLLGGLLVSPPWQSLLEPHLLELCGTCVICISVMKEGDAKFRQVHAERAIECLGSLAAIVRGEEAARLFHHQVVGLLVSDPVLGSELCDAALEALSRAAAADELLIADASFYVPGQPPSELCRVVQLALTASVTQRGQRRLRALRLLHSIADSHSRLLCVQGEGQLSAEKVLVTLVELVAPDEVRAKASCAHSNEGHLVGNSAQSAAEYALLTRISKRMPDKLVLPIIYRSACRTLMGSDLPAKLAALASLRAVLPGCTSGVKKQLHRISRLVLRALAQPALHVVAFALVADLCALIPAETRCGSARLTERLLPPLLQQLQYLQLRDPAFPHALAALEAACPRSACGRLLPAFRPPQSGVAVLMWACEKLGELGELQQDALEPQLADSIAQRLCTLISVLAMRQHSTRHTAESLKTAGRKMVAVLQQMLTSAYSVEARSAALEASGTWIKLMADTGSRRPEFLKTCLQAVENGLRDECDSLSSGVSAEASVRFCVALGPLAPSPGAVAVAGLECCARRPRPDLLRALAALVASTQCLHSVFGDLASPEWSRLAQLLSGFLEQRELRGATAELARHVPLCKATAVLLARLAACVEVEERPEVFRSLCTAAAHMAAQEEPSQELGEAMQMLREAAKTRRSAPMRATALQSSDEDSSVTSDCPSSASDESAPTVASTADLEGPGAGQALQSRHVTATFLAQRIMAEYIHLTLAAIFHTASTLVDFASSSDLLAMPTLFPEPVDLQGAEQPDGPLWERPSVLRAVFAAGQEHEDAFFSIVLLMLATTALACGAALAGFAYIRRHGAPGSERRDVRDQRRDVLLDLAEMEEGRAVAASVANVGERCPTGEAASPEPEVDFDEVPDLDHVGYMLDLLQDRRDQRRAAMKELTEKIEEAAEARRAGANAQQVALGGRAAVPRAPQLPRPPPLPRTRQATAMTFATQAPPPMDTGSSGSASSEVPPPFGDADGWETWSPNTFYDEALPDWALPEEEP